MADATSFVNELEYLIGKLNDEVKDEHYSFSSKPLSYMPIVNRYNELLLPCKSLLLQINETNIKGLEDP